MVPSKICRADLIRRAEAAVRQGKYSNVYEYYRALVLMVGPGSAPYYNWKPIASKLMLETEPPPLPEVLRPWAVAKGKKK